MKDFKESLIISVISGMLLFVTLSIYNKVTNDPEEVTTVTHMIKITILTIIIITSVLYCNNENSRPSSEILTKFDE